MKRSYNPVLLMLLGVLIITNLVMLWYFTRNSGSEKKWTGPTERMAAMMQRELNFTDAQVAEYLTLRSRRDSIMRPLNDSLRAAKMAMISLLRGPEVSDSLILLAAEKVSQQQMPVEIAFYRHFRRVQALCTETQRPAFDSMLVKMIRRNTGDTTFQAAAAR